MKGHRGRQRAYAGGLAFSYTLGSRWARSLTEPPLGSGQATLPNTEGAGPFSFPGSAGRVGAERRIEGVVEKGKRGRDTSAPLYRPGSAISCFPSDMIVKPGQLLPPVLVLAPRW